MRFTWRFGCAQAGAVLALVLCATSARAADDYAVGTFDTDIAMADGSYGVCLHCEEDIKPKRLEAVPWAPYCIRCQEAADRREFDSSDVFDELLANAA